MVGEVTIIIKHRKDRLRQPKCIFLAKNLVYHDKMKHIDVQYHFVRDIVLAEKVDTLKNVADSLTKFVPTKKFSWSRE
jgi:hypothetical protein